MAALVFIFYKSGVELEKLLVLSTVPFLLALIVIDLKYKILPNILLAILAVIGILRIALIYIGNNLADPFLVIDYFIAAVVYGVFSYVLGMIMQRALAKKHWAWGI